MDTPSPLPPLFPLLLPANRLSVSALWACNSASAAASAIIFATLVLASVIAGSLSDMTLLTMDVTLSLAPDTEA